MSIITWYPHCSTMLMTRPVSALDSGVGHPPPGSSARACSLKAVIAAGSGEQTNPTEGAVGPSESSQLSSVRQEGCCAPPGRCGAAELAVAGADVVVSA